MSYLRPRKYVRAVNRDGFWLTVFGRDICYWTPWAWKPLSVRLGDDVSPHLRRGWWGACRVRRLTTPNPHTDDNKAD